MKIVLILDNIRSMYNVGAIFRTADGLGVSKIYLTGITPTPPRKEIHKTALGAESRVPWEYSEKLQAPISKLQKEGFVIAALEITPAAISIQNYPISHIAPMALILGHERDGVASDALELADVHLMIPMTGNIKSFNVSTAAAIALWQLRYDTLNLQT